MVYSEAYKRVTDWLTLSGIETESGQVLDSEGRCLVSQGDDRDCVVMLPPGQATLYFVAALYTPDLDTDGDLLAFCLCLNAYSLGYLKTAAIGLDADNREIILRSAIPLQHDARTDLGSLLEEFLDQASEIRQQIRTYRQNGDIESSHPEGRGGSFDPANTLRA